MTYPDPSELNFEIYTDPPPPPTARELVGQQGFDSVLEALPENARRDFDRQHPRRTIDTAHRRLDDSERALEGFDDRIREVIETRGYSREAAQLVYDQTHEQREGLVGDLDDALNSARAAVRRQKEGLISFIDRHQLVERVAFNLGYSMQDPQVAAGSSRANGHGNGRPPLREVPGDRRQRRGRG